MSLRTAVWGGYSPLRRAYRRFRPSCMGLLTPSGRAAAAFVRANGSVVLRGPFAGMAYPSRSLGHVSFLAAKLLGSYELETYAALERVIAARPAQIVDVGSADGYYIVGLARRAPQAAVIGFETDAGERRRASEMARLNGVAASIAMRGRCDPATLARALGEERAVFLCDCEGYERELLDPARVPQLRSATILAELHPMFSPGIEELVIERFAETHNVEVIRMRFRHSDDWAELRALSATGALLGLSEGWRSHEEWHSPAFQRCWAYMTPKTVR